MSAEELARADWEKRMSPVRIATKHGLSVNTVKSWIKRKWKQGAGCKKGAEVAPHAPAPASIDQRIANAVEENEKLTAQQKDFCVYYMRNRNATQAYLKAYGCAYTTANTNGPALLVKTHIKEEVRRLREIKNAALGDLCGADVVELHMRIAFADITDFVEFENVRRPLLVNGGPVMVPDPDGGKDKALAANVNEVRLKNSVMVDGNVVMEVSQGRDGAKIRLANRQHSLDFLVKYFELNPMDRHRVEYDRQRLALEDRRIRILEGEDDGEDDVRIEIVRKSGADSE
jgi:phage terminase small subunit